MSAPSNPALSAATTTADADRLRQEQLRLAQVSARLEDSEQLLALQVQRLHAELAGSREARAREQAEKARLADRLQSVLDLLPAGVIVLDGRGRVAEANPAAHRLLGEPLLGELWRDLVQQRFAEAAADGQWLQLNSGLRVSLATCPLTGEPGQLVLLNAIEALRRLPARALEADAPVACEPSSVQLLALAARIARSEATVLICGESGTGKEVLARYIHQQSARAAQPFVAINCAAIPESMLEGMLFGHEKGAFTGALSSQPGKFEQANGGTLLLDEISEMSPALQAKLLRVLQEREVERIGGRRPVSLDLRVLATSNRDLQTEVAAGRFREDLYYRLAVFVLQWQPLRQRPGDILPLAAQLLQRHVRRLGQAEVPLSAAAREALLRHDWPGNVRELDNALQRAAVLQQGGEVQVADLCLQGLPVVDAVACAAVPVAEAGLPRSLPADVPLGDGVRQREFELIAQVMRELDGRRAEVARRLDISPRTLRYKLAQMREAGWPEFS